MANKGYITAIRGPVVDVSFEDNLPPVNNAIKVKSDNKDLILEVMSHIGNNMVRCIALSATEGLKRGMEAEDTGRPIEVPVGDAVLGRMFNVFGQPIDYKGPIENATYNSIHRDPPSFEDQSPSQQIFETGIKVIDLLAPYVKDQLIKVK